MAERSGMKLGRTNRPIPARVPTFRDHAIAAIQAPARLMRDHIVYAPQMDDNDTLSDCTAAGLANLARGEAALAGWQLTIPTADVLKFYSQSTGYVPGQPATDQGGVMVDVLTSQQRQGFDIGQLAPFVGLWGNLAVDDLNLVRVVMSRLGIAYVGIDLALADQTSGIWDIDSPASQGDPTPGSWGGHCVCFWDYTGTADTDIVRIVTWGGLQSATWRWVRSRMVEVYGLYHPQFANAAGQNFAGIDEQKLAADNSAFAAIPV